MSFVSLHTHSDHSIHDGFQSVEMILARCSALGQTAVALTDHGTMSGCGEGFRLHNKYGIKFIAGCEHYLCSDVTIKDKELNHIILLAMDATGYRNLNILTTIAHSEGNFYFKPRLDLRLLEEHSEGIICSTACLAGCQSRIQELKGIFGDRLYVEIHTNSMKEQKEKNLKWINLADKFDVPIYTAVDAHYLTSQQGKYQDRWTPFEYDEKPLDFYLHSEEEVYSDLKYLPHDIVEAAVNETQKVADRCSFELSFGENHYPKSPYKSPRDEIRMRTWEGCKIHGVAKDERHIKQIRHELEVLEKVDYFDYFLIVSDMINWCKDHGIRTGVGRGSVVGSDIAYNMGITKIDPLKHGLIFERFAHAERVTPPDIDTDIQRSRRQEVIKYLRDTYGHVYQVVTFNRMAEKSAIRRAASAFKLDPQTTNKICEKYNGLEQLSQAEEDTDGVFLPGEFEEFKNTAAQFFGKLQNYGTHASAVVILTTDPYDFCAIERFSGAKGPQYNLNYEFHDLEAMGLLKLDILGLEALDLIDNTLAMIPEKFRPDMDSLDENDKATYALLNEDSVGGRAGLFQIEGYTIGKVLRKIQPQSLADLTAVIALGRPGPIDAGETDRYIDSKGAVSGTNKEQLRCLTDLCKETYGCMIYQEQVMNIVRKIWGTSMGEADMIRRACGRKDPELMKKLISDLKGRRRMLDYSDEEIGELLNKINSASGYLFNKSHSVAYAYTAYQTAYLKANYPLQFFTALLNSSNDQDKKREYMNEARSRGIKVEFPNIVGSNMDFTTDGNSIIAGLAYIRGVGGRKIVAPTSDTQDGLKEFLEQNKGLNKQVCVNLVKAGCFNIDPGWGIQYIEWFKDSGSRRDECLERINYYTDEKPSERMVNSWERKLEEIPSPPDPDSVTPLTSMERLSMQKEVLGESDVDVFSGFSRRLISKGNKMVLVSEVSKRKTNKGDTLYKLVGRMEGKDIMDEFLFFKPTDNVAGKLDLLLPDSVYIVRCSPARGSRSYWATDLIKATPLPLAQ